MSVLLFMLFLATLIVGVVRVVLTLQGDEFKVSPLIPWVIASVPFLLIWLAFTQVNAGSVGVVTRNGKVVDTLSPGPHLLIPMIEQSHEMTTQTLVVRPSEDAASHDLQMVHTEVTLAYHFDPEFMGYIYSHLTDASDNSVEHKVVIPAILEAIKARTAQYDAQQLIAERAAVRDGIEVFVKARLAAYHVIPETVSITDFHFSPDYEKAIESKVTAQQNAEKAQNDLIRIKVEAEQQIAQAKGEAEALRAQKEQITPELLQLRTVEMMMKKWDGVLPQNYYGGTAPLPVMEVLRGIGKK